MCSIFLTIIIPVFLFFVKTACLTGRNVHDIIIKYMYKNVWFYKKRKIKTHRREARAVAMRLRYTADGECFLRPVEAVLLYQ